MFDTLAEKFSQFNPIQWIVVLSILVLPAALYLMLAQAWFGIFALVLNHCLMLAMFYALSQSLNQVRKAAKQLSEGDLTVRIPLQDPEARSLSRTVNRIGEDISRTVHALRKSTARLLNVADTVQKDSEISQAGAIGQKQDVDRAKTIINQLSDITQQVSDHCDSTSKLANEAKQKADLGSRDMVALEEALNSANQHIDNSNEHFQSLMAETSQISQVMETISSIADQTNLLALNAAIESARAGEQGRGFAVVADEVRTLAMRTQEATEEIRDKINNLQDKTDDVLETMKENKISMDKSLALASTAEQSFKALDLQIEEVRSYSQQIARSSEAQLSQTHDLDNCLQQITQESDNNVQSTRETLRASITVRNLSGEIDSLLHRFATNPTQIQQEESKRDKLMEWNEQLDIGLDEINRQHQTLLHLVNELYYLLKHNYGLSSVKRVVQGLIDYTANHFKYEETLFAQIGYGQTQEHIAKHAQLVDEVLAFQKRVERGEDIGEELMSFLKNWLSQHIMREDKAYTDVFKQNGLS
ncbi:MAG: bacteriohemerythrin [Vibrio sp.]|uniref:bacteriohemerythrin n=1 Tax=Vibrio sp. TaxID=678 RepID=UPI001EC0FC17|nr:bacteriohemerythrin [Vibrio sp.]NRB67100.1 bacteriohemerythrin [Vibrio sp.]